MRPGRGLVLSAAAIVVLIFVAAFPGGAWARIHDKFLCLGEPPTLVGIFEFRHSEVSQLPEGVSSSDVITMPFLTCPSYEVPTSGGIPMVIWLKVTANRYVSYGRGGGP